MAPRARDGAARSRRREPAGRGGLLHFFSAIAATFVPFRNSNHRASFHLVALRRGREIEVGRVFVAIRGLTPAADTLFVDLAAAPLRAEKDHAGMTTGCMCTTTADLGKRHGVRSIDSCCNLKRSHSGFFQWKRRIRNAKENESLRCRRATHCLLWMFGNGRIDRSSH